VIVRQIKEYDSFPFTYVCRSILFQNAVLLSVKATFLYHLRNIDLEISESDVYETLT